MQKTWSIFSKSTPTNPNAGPNGVTRWDGTTLYYYQQGRHFGQSAQQSVGDLLGPTYGGSGQCGVWAMLLQDAWTLNGVVSTLIDAQIIPSYGYQLFWVNAWTINDMTKDFEFPNFKFPGEQYPVSNDLLPTPTGGNYSAMTNATGAAGQNSPTPSEKCWGDHAFVQYGTTSLYYDPSYGLIHTSPADLQSTCIKCFGKRDTNAPQGTSRYILTQETNTAIYFPP